MRGNRILIWSDGSSDDYRTLVHIGNIYLPFSVLIAGLQVRFQTCSNFPFFLITLPRKGSFGRSIF